MCFHCSGGFFIFPDFFGNFLPPPSPPPARPPTPLRDSLVILSWCPYEKNYQKWREDFVKFYPSNRAYSMLLQASHFWQWLYTKSAAEMLPQPLTRLYHLFTYTINHNLVSSITSALADMEDIGLPYAFPEAWRKCMGLTVLCKVTVPCQRRRVSLFLK